MLKREAGQHTVPLGPANVVLRGCMLRNTPHIHGLVIYTGHESKIMLNSSAPPSKRSHLERNLDKLVAVMFSILFSMCFIGAVVLGVWMQQHGKQHWYLEFNSPYDDPTTAKVWNVDKPVTVALLNFLTLITLYSTLIPISLYVSIEIIKFTQATFLISMDPHMFHKESGTPALARTSNLNEELGQVEYVFSDKTGTLTQVRVGAAAGAMQECDRPSAATDWLAWMLGCRVAVSTIGSDWLLPWMPGANTEQL